MKILVFGYIQRAHETYPHICRHNDPIRQFAFARGLARRGAEVDIAFSDNYNGITSPNSGSTKLWHKSDRTVYPNVKLVHITEMDVGSYDAVVLWSVLSLSYLMGENPLYKNRTVSYMTDKIVHNIIEHPNKVLKLDDPNLSRLQLEFVKSWLPPIKAISFPAINSISFWENKFGCKLGESFVSFNASIEDQFGFHNPFNIGADKCIHIDDDSFVVLYSGRLNDNTKGINPLTKLRKIAEICTEMLFVVSCPKIRDPNTEATIGFGPFVRDNAKYSFLEEFDRLSKYFPEKNIIAIPGMSYGKILELLDRVDAALAFSYKQDQTPSCGKMWDYFTRGVPSVIEKTIPDDVIFDEIYAGERVSFDAISSTASGLRKIRENWEVGDSLKLKKHALTYHTWNNRADDFLKVIS